ncbi:IS630 family transposase [Pelomicrobium methylotrophicum]|uniref:IS630 family transposase n=1 Tax=Pelomicrobium methylotrophicum TaxID=2602750 RepID=A0A5C7EPT9_9PROT|nr:IS630 family transposase [Pelomicrobium methylotrophicum]
MAVKMDEAAKRRVRAGRLLLKGKKPAEVAAIVGAPRQTVYRWLGVLQEKGIDGLREMSKGGRPSRMRAGQLEELRQALLAGPIAAGYGTDLWTLKRVRLLIEKRFGIKYSEVQVWRILGAMGFSNQKPERRAIERNEEAVAHWKKRTWPVLKKKPRREGRVIVFIDESGLSERPTRVRTWAPKGQTPVIQFHFNWKQLSMIAGVSFTNAYFRLHEGSIKSAQIVDFLEELVRQIGRKLLIIWDGLKAHRSRVVRDYVDGLDGKIELAFLPPYAPELNPVEYLWAWLKRHALANYCPDSLAELATTARGKLRSAQRRTTLIAAFWKQAELF